MYPHQKIEEETGAFWKKERMYEKSRKRNEKGKPFYFCDGPPYVTGSIHPGTGWNKCLKDFICRYWRMKGYDVRAQAGFDTHGLPIEVKVEQELKIKNKNEIEKMGIEKFVKKCKQFATHYIGVMSEQFLRLGVWMDFDSPYITYTDAYIAASWKTLKTAWDKGLMHEGVYVLPYCYRCETTMANYELEYDEETDPSIYVKFRSREKENEYFLIWTTTPWTLVTNMAIMVHPTLAYVKLGVGSEEWWVARERMDAVLEMLGKSAAVLEEQSGKKLEGKLYEHPFQDKIHKQAERRIVLSDEYVTVEEGTGLVHTAPGTGPEDFVIGKRFGIEPYCPVDTHGDYTEDAGKMFAGKNVRQMNPEIIRLLEEKKVLLHEARVRHRYPHCWRCKTPLIFLTTQQWFITIGKIKERMQEEIEKVNWYPTFVKNRFAEFVQTAPDWCISRQRYWGIPLPIWRCEKCRNVRAVGSPEELPKIKELHRPYVDAVTLPCKCKGKMHRIPDVLDVWFDSGNAVWAPLNEEERKRYGEQADLIVEGQDQIRGWFYSLLGSGVVRNNASPYKQLLMHGFFVDEKGEKMSKSLGNFVPLEKIIERYGVDSFRLWSLSNTAWEELKFNWEELKKANADLNIVLNLVSFLERFYPKNRIEPAGLEVEDRWIRSRWQSVLREFLKAAENYEIHRAVKALRRFFVEDVSRFYMKIAKERVAEGRNREAALATLYEINEQALRLLTPVAPFISEYLYQRFFMKYEKEESVSWRPFPTVDETQINPVLEKQMQHLQGMLSELLNARQEADIKLRWPLRSAMVKTDSHEIREGIERLGGIIQRLGNVKEVKLVSQAPKEKTVKKDFEGGTVYVPTTMDEELYAEGVGNEIKRRIQNLRKVEGLVEKNKITVFVDTAKEFQGILEKQKERLLREVHGAALKFEKAEKMEEFQVDGRLVRIAIEKTK